MATPEGEAPVDLAVEAGRAPRGEEARLLPRCDLVMKGGITSGVVYPGAAIALARTYRFASLGGTSAGAIAAGVCAAAEYGRLRDRGTGLSQLGKVTDDLSQADFLLGLFQAAPGGKAALDLGLAVGTGGGAPLSMRFLRVGSVACRRARPVLIAGAAAVAAFVLLLIALYDSRDSLAWLWVLLLGVPGLLVLILLTVVGAVALIARRTLHALPDSSYGLCPGVAQPGYPAGRPALTEWLDGHIQKAAGRLERDASDVLTVADLRESEITLETMTTDLSGGRPLRCPADLGGYGFRAPELLRLFPRHVVECMVRSATGAAPADEVDLDSDILHRVEPERLPVLVAVRLSLSFPGLLSAVRLHDAREGAEPRPVLLSDGGIASNFPVHFFDAWFPRWPTFGIDLGRHPGGSAPTVAMHGEGGPRSVPIAGAGVFLGQVKDTMQNWRDNLQTELPGYRDRVCEVRFQKGEGGLNIQMKLPAIDALMQRGFRAGRLLADALPPPAAPGDRWDEHRLKRFEILMRLQQLGLQTVAERVRGRDGFLAALRAGRIRSPTRPEQEFSAWAPAAAEQTNLLLDCACRWGDPPQAVDFAFDPAPEPEPVMRVVPKA